MATRPDLGKLPIDKYLPGIVESLEECPNHLIVAEPGAGKTTRVPQALLDAGFAARGEILVLEPRRIAARLAASRVAEERGTSVGQEIGYKVRFSSKVSPATQVCFLTEGILTRRLNEDPQLKGVGTVVLDEFHERHLDGDLCLAWLRRLQSRGHALRIIAMSATLEAAPLAEFLDAPITEVEGRTYPVEVEYQTPGPRSRLEREVATAVRRLVREGPKGDVLVFLPGAAEIRRAKQACAAVVADFDYEIAVLHGDLPVDQQHRVVRAASKHRIILSTNVAESSVTLPGVVAVVDSGLVRVASFSPFSGVPSIELTKVSQASAVQRAGRAGRLGPGRCVRLYSEHDFRSRRAYEGAEIGRADMMPTCLLLRSQEDDPATFPFFEAPPKEALDSAERALERLGAVDQGGLCTDIGRALLRLPVHPRHGRLALAAKELGVGARGALMAALVGEREIRREVRTRFEHSEAGDREVGASDLIARLERYEAAAWEGGGRDAWRRFDLDPAATQAVGRVRDSITRALGLGRDPEPEMVLAEEEERLLVATLLAFPDRVGRRRRKGEDEVVLAAGGAARLAQSSVVRDAEYVVAVEVSDGVRGGRTLRVASQVEPEWLLEHCAERIGEEEGVFFDAERERVFRRRALTFDGLVLDESTSYEITPEEGASVLAEAALRAGFAEFCEPADLQSLALRSAFAAANGGPDVLVTEEALRTALRDACLHALSFDDLRAARPWERLLAQLGPENIRALDRFAPKTVQVGASGRVRINYEHDRPPWVQARLQDFFGMADGPRVAGGGVPLVLHLLAPNRRAVQVTTDLAGFWERHYPDLRKSLMRRYSRHYWPDNPRTAKSPKSGLKRHVQDEKG